MDFNWELIPVMVLLALLIFKRTATVFYLKFFAMYFWVIVLETLAIPIILLRPKKVENLTMVSQVMAVTSIFAGLDYSLRGLEHIGKDATSVIVVNHQSSLDLICMFKIWRFIKRATAVAKREVMYVGTFGLAMYLSGLTFINRKAGGKAGQVLNEALLKLKEERIKLFIFPEGTRRNTGEIHQFKKGGFHAAIYAQVPVVPVVVSSYKSFLDVKNKMFNSGSVIVEALPEISTKGMTTKDVDRLIEITRNAMIEKYDELNLEIGSKQK